MKPKGRATPKPKAEAGHIEIDRASQTHSDPFASSSVTIEEVAMHLAEGTFLQSDHTAFTFYTTFLPSFHSTSATDESGVLPPILATGATRCLLPLSWLSPEEASSSKRIHFKVTTGTSVRALLYNNVIYSSMVTRPFISVGHQFKTKLDLRFHWDDSSPTLLVCSGGVYILLEASVVHHLPVLSSEEMMAILEATHCFTATGKMWNAKMWEEKLQRSLLIFHENFPPTTSTDAPPHPHQDPEVMFSSLTQPDVVDGTSNHLSSTTVIHNLMDNNATTEDEQPQVDDIEKKERNRRKRKKGPNIEDLSPSEVVELDKKLIINHRLPKGKTTYQRGGRWICSSRTTTGGLHH